MVFCADSWAFTHFIIAQTYASIIHFARLSHRYCVCKNFNLAVVFSKDKAEGGKMDIFAIRENALKTAEWSGCVTAQPAI